MKNLKVLTILLAVLLVGSIANAEEPVTIEHWYDVPQSQQDAYQEMIDKFNETHEDVQVDWRNIPPRELEDKLTIGSQVGDLPDTYVVSSNSAAKFMAMDIMAPLDDYIAEWDGRNNIQDSLWNAAKYGDKTYGIPWKTQVMYLYYRADWFEEKGIEPPKTISELTEAAKKLTEDTDGDGRVDRYGIGLRGGPGAWSHYGVWVWDFGAEYIDEDGNVAFNSEEAVEGTQWLINLYREFEVTPRSVPSDSFQQIIQNFKTGNTAMQLHHIGTYAEMEKALGDKVSAMPVPAGPNGEQATLATVHMHAVSSRSDKKEAAFEFVSFMSEEWAVEHQCKEIGAVPVLDSVGEQDYFQNNRFYKASIDSIPFAKYSPKSTAYAEATGDIEKYYQQGLIGEKSAAEVVESIAKALKERVDD